MIRNVSDQALLEAHDRLKAMRLAKTRYLKLDASEKRAYSAEKNRERRARLKEARAEGKPEQTVPAIRDALADAAATILRTDGPGADMIRAALVAAFRAPAFGMTVTNMAKSGRLPPKLLSPDWSPKPKASLAAAPADPLPPATVPDPLDDLDDEGFEPPAFLRKPG